ncbi:helix-turn-helix domain-containing protein [Psychroflexus salis]|uniref:Transcriptional regulator n=1 Tax=Psychroflexus salis TaxID=1526574 RepID=A0A916ZR60_9FLAO|nr:helix-turn-helix transcriptional regulator [Psychroflexus salis]GGE08200.1 transcriptional regulator [Psychroflexus salis]
MLVEKIPRNIKKFRELKNYTREEMAAFLEMSSSGYAKIEQGNVDISIRRLEQIAEILQVEVRQILEFEVSQIFNISENTITNSNAIVGKSKTRDLLKKDSENTYLVKLVETLERENALLRNQLKSEK